MAHATDQDADLEKLLEEEQQAFDHQAHERIKNGLIPDLRRLEKVPWFYNNVWRDPKMVEIHWMPRINRIIEQAKGRGGSVLELGCGFGMIALELARNGLDVTGMDLSPAHIEIAERFRDENPYTEGFGFLNYRSEDILKADLGEESFDTVLFFRALHHMPDIDTVLDKVERCLKPGGFLLISEPVRAHFSRQSALFATLLRTVLPTWEGDEKLDGPWNDAAWSARLDEVFKEYTFDDHHEQSPLDNSLDDADQISAAIGRRFDIIETRYGDAFMDKLIGGLRGEDRYRLAEFLTYFDQAMVRQGVLPPTSMELCAVKR